MQNLLIVVGALLVAAVAQLLYNHVLKLRKIKKFGAGPIPVAANGPLGWKGLQTTLRIFKLNLGPTGLEPQFQKYGKTHLFPIGVTPVIATREPENIKAMLATQFKDFSLGVRKRALGPSLGDGIFTLDGAGWTHSRALLRPQFAREQVSRLDSLEHHFQIFLRCVDKEMSDPKNASSGFDIQKLFFAMTIDTATEFLFGESTDAMEALLSDTNPEGLSHGDFVHPLDFAVAFDRAQRISALRHNLQDLYFVIGNLFMRQEFSEVNHRVKSFVEGFAKKAITARKEKSPLLDSDSGQYIFMYELVKQTTDLVTLRDQMLNILLAGRDTTASTLAWTYYCLVRDPQRYAKLREAVLNDFGTSPESITFESLKTCDYLRFVLNEILRLYPVVPANTRTATRDTTLPTGGGPNRDKPVFVAKGQVVLYSVYWTHRDPQYWGEDADEFNPERWDKGANPVGRGWEYLPFNGGPRICLGQQFALTEMGYIIARLVQEFETLENCDDHVGPPALNHNLTMCHGYGVFLKMFREGEKNV